MSMCIAEAYLEPGRTSTLYSGVLNTQQSGRLFSVEIVEGQTGFYKHLYIICVFFQKMQNQPNYIQIISEQSQHNLP